MDIPIEVLMHIFKYLPFSDKIAASQTCRFWYEAANDKGFKNSKLVFFFKTNLEDDLSTLNIFLNSDNIFHHFAFKEVEITSKIKEFWPKFGNHVKSLTFDSCDIREKVFSDILKECNYLESLTVHSCRELFMSGRLLEGDNGEDPLKIRHKLKALTLSGNRYLSDAIFNRFVSIAPILEELCLSGCSVTFHSGLYKKFYPFGFCSKDGMTASDNVLTFHYILNFIVAHANTLKKISFSDTLFDGQALLKLSEIPNLKLDILELHSCDQLTNVGISALTNHQVHLKVLNLGLCSRVTDQSLMSICEKLINLQYLNIQRCRAVTDLGVMELFKLKKLKYLNISQCELITSSGIEQGICKDKNLILSELILSSLNLDQRIILIISENLPNLTLLDVSYCFNAVTDSSIQAIFKNQIWLRCLKLSHCDKVSDAGLTGMGKGNNDNLQNDDPIMSNIHDPITSFKISLRSRAEEEIVNDAKRKKKVMRMCENVDNESFPGYSLARLRGLQELDVSGCNRITDVSLRYAFHFKELKRLNLSECQQITHEGLVCIASNCPSIETINLVDCYNIKDEGVLHLLSGLSRLKYLHLRGCNQLSNNTILAIRSKCKSLKLLDIQGCRHISAELAADLSFMPTLHTLLISKPGPYLTDGLKNRQPVPHPPPLLSSLRYGLFFNSQ